MSRINGRNDKQEKFPILYLQQVAQRTRDGVSKVKPSDMMNDVHAVSTGIDGIHTDSIHEKNHGPLNVTKDCRKVQDIDKCLVLKLLSSCLGTMREVVFRQ
jgi:hypothetical protein